MIDLEKRNTIEKMIGEKTLLYKIAEELGVHISTIYREIKRCNGKYNAKAAHATKVNWSRPVDDSIVGKKYGLLTVVSYVKTHNLRTWWNCKCECGEKSIISRKMLFDYCSEKRKLSCGCIPKEHKGGGNKVPFGEASLRKYQDLICFRRINRDCWEWTGYRNKNKTPVTSWKSKVMSVRKCMYLIFNNTSYEPNPVFTTCGNLLCFNPDHITIERPLKRQYYDE